MCLCTRIVLDTNQDSQDEVHDDHITCCLSITQAQHGAGLAAAVALLRPVSSQPVSSEAHPALSGVAAQRAPLRRLSAAAAELSEVRPNVPSHTSQTHSSQQRAPKGVYETEVTSCSPWTHDDVCTKSDSQSSKSCSEKSTKQLQNSCL